MSARRIVGPHLLILAAALIAGCGSEARSGTESDLPDASAPDSSLPTFDGGGSVDVGEQDTGPSAGELGDPCSTDNECEDFVCARLEPGAPGFCSTECREDADCPTSWECVFLTNSGTDATRVCLPTDACVDQDDDGYGVGPGCAGPDCNDLEGSVNPRAPELCDGIDNDCDDLIDDGPVDANQDCATGFPGPCGEGRSVCRGGALDCEARFTPLAEVCDGVDNDCDGTTDEGDSGEPLARECYTGDPGTESVGECAGGNQTCSAGEWGRCLDEVTPIPELCDGLDNDCNGTPDDDIEDQPFYPDLDEDGYGDRDAEPVIACLNPDGYVLDGSDCDDTTSDVSPLGVESCNGIDDDCDDQVDEGSLCYPNGEPCDDDLDCASALCLDGICRSAGLCAEPGACPTRVAPGIGGGARSSESYNLQIGVGVPFGATTRTSESARIRLGAGHFVIPE